MRVVIYGSRPDGHAKVLIDLLASVTGFEPVGLIDDVPENRTRKVRGLSVLGGHELLDDLPRRGVEGLLIGFGDGPGRRAAVAAARRAGLELPRFIHPTAMISATASIGDGCQILSAAYVGPDAVLAEGVLVNTGALVEHDAAIGDGVALGPGAVITGRVTVGAGAEIGANATILPDCRVGEDARVGGGAVVTRDVAGGATAVGVPARERPA